MKRLYIFDMDGLLLDTETLYQQFWFKVLQEKNIDITREELRKIIGMSYDQAKNYFLNYVDTEEEFIELRQRREVYFWEHVENIGMPLREGADQILSYLRENNIKTALITSTEEQRAKKLMNIAGLNHSFDYMVFSNMVTKTKPDPEMYHYLEKLTDIDKREWIVFEDSYSGLKAANNAGVDVVWIKDLAILMDDNVDYIQEHNSLLDVLNNIHYIQSL